MSKSLLQRSAEGFFRLHPLVRDFAKTQADAGVLAKAQLRHAEHFLNRLVRVPAFKISGFVRQRVDGLVLQAEDFAKAWRFAVDAGRSDLLKVALPNLIFFIMAARYQEAGELATYASAGLPDSPAMVATLAAVRAEAAFRLGRMDEAQAVAKAALDRKPKGRALALLNLVLSRLHRFRGDHEIALAYAQRALEALGASDAHAHVKMQVLEELADCHWTLWQLQSCESCLLTNLALAKKHDAKSVEGRSLCKLGVIKDATGSSSEALTLLESSIRIFTQMNDPYELARCQRYLSYVYLNLSDLDRQAEMAQASLEGFRTAGYYLEVAESLFAVLLAHDAAGRAAEATLVAREALRLCLQVDNVPVALRCVFALGVYALPDSRQAGLALMCFSAGHPALRKRDLAYIERRLESIGVSQAELIEGREQATSWTLEYVGGKLLAPGA